MNSASTQQAAPQLIDRDLLVKRRARAAHTAEQYDFLLTRAADDIAERLQFVKRAFSSALVLGSHHGVLGRRLRGLGSIESVTSLDSCSALLDN